LLKPLISPIELVIDPEATNNIIEIASFTTPSPKTTLNNFGY
jgi:hypothetical protein